ncbi:MAG: hypothetical protein ABWZ66_07295 [Pyrinomonadaceae bacterium]
MAIKLSKICLVLFFLLAASSAIGQVPGATPTLQQKIEIQRRISEEEARKRQRESSDRMIILSEIYDSYTRQASAINREKRNEELKTVAVEKEDLNNFRRFLEQPGTGMMRLRDLSECEIKRKCLQLVAGFGSAYSFHKKTYVEKFYADILFSNAAFHIQGLNTLGFLTDLGDVSIDNLSLTTSGIKEMAEFEPTDKAEAVKSQLFIVKKGFQVGDFTYKTSVSFKESSTYALRSITYRVIGKSSKPEKNDKKLKDKWRDIIIVFRVIRKYADGSVSLLWKELQDKDAPTIEIEENK